MSEYIIDMGNSSYQTSSGLLCADVSQLRNEIVRCRDCKYYLHSNEKCELLDTRLHFYETHNRWTDDAFCAWGTKGK